MASSLAFICIYLVAVSRAALDIDPKSTVNDNSMDKSDMRDSEYRLQKLEEKYHHQTTALKALELSCAQRLNSVEEMVGKVAAPGSLRDRRSPTETVSFYATLSSRLGTLAHSQPLIFDSVESHTGNEYDARKGVFTCALAGTYVFAVTVVVRPRKGLELTIVKNGANVGYIYASSNNDRYDSGSNMVILDLQIGDTVWVTVHGTYHDDGDVIDNGFTTFAGFLV